MGDGQGSEKQGGGEVRWWFGVPYPPGVEIGLKKQWSQF